MASKNPAPSKKAPVSAHISVIIPCRNEAKSLPQLLQALQSQQEITIQVIVADGGSHDDTLLIAQQHGVESCQCAAGRGKQMNAATQRATAPWLLYLHADSRFTHPRQLADALAYMQANTANDKSVAGHFSLRFYDTTANHKRWKILEHKTTLQLPLTINGDQGLLIHREYFAELGGFNSDQHFLEDQKIAQRIRQTGRWLLLPHRLQTSARRFETEGFSQRYWLMTLIMIAWLGGLNDFLNRGIYQDQNQTAKLTLRHHIRHFLSLACKLPFYKQLMLYWRTADLARSNSYQILIWLDATIGLQHWPLSHIWLKTITPLSQLPVIRQGLQIILLPVFPIIATSVLLAAKIADTFSTPASTHSRK